MTDDQLIESLRARTWPGDCEAAAFRLEELRARVAELEALPGNVLAQRVENLEADRDALAGISKELIERLREAAAQRVASTAMIGADDLIAAADALEIATAGMNAYCDELGSCRKAAGFGSADDPMAQEGVGAFSDPLCVAAFVESQFKRIVAERDALAAELKALREQEPVAWADEPWMASFGVRVGRDSSNSIDLIFTTVWQRKFQLYAKEAAYLRWLLNKAEIPGYPNTHPSPPANHDLLSHQRRD